MTTVFLSEWEWACCGDPFAVGDHVEFGAVEASRELRELCAPAAAPDFAETHHDDEPPFLVSGIVRAVSALFVDHRTIRVPRQGPTGPARAFTTHGSWQAGAIRAPYVLTSERLPASARLESLDRIDPRGGDDDEVPRPDPADGDVDARLEGYLVTVDED